MLLNVTEWENEPRLCSTFGSTTENVMFTIFLFSTFHTFWKLLVCHIDFVAGL